MEDVALAIVGQLHNLSLQACATGHQERFFFWLIAYL